MAVVPFMAGVLLLAMTTANAATHKVSRGESLWTISKKYNVSVAALLEANNLSESSVLQIGQSLTIPGTSSGGNPSGGAVATGVVARTAILRSEPSSNSERVATLQPGVRLQIFQTKWDWHQVVTDSGQKGWVANFLVTITNRVDRSRPTNVASRGATGAGSNVVRTAQNYLGARYRYGGSSRGGFDCSGFTRYIYAQHGVNLPHNSAAQFQRGTSVAKSDLQAGDLVFFSRGGRAIGHVGIYIGNGRFIHASNPQGGVKIDSLASGSYARQYKGARRVN